MDNAAGKRWENLAVKRAGLDGSTAEPLEKRKKQVSGGLFTGHPFLLPLLRKGKGMRWRLSQLLSDDNSVAQRIA